MKQIINMYERYGAELHTRQLVERLSASLDSKNDYLLDMKGVLQISRSAADELYSLSHGDKNVDIINVEPFVEKMLSAVTLGRFLPRKRPSSNLTIIECPTIEGAVQQLVPQL